MLFTIAHLPESRIRALPVFANPIQPTANPYPRIVCNGAHIFVVQKKRIHKLPIDIKLELRHGSIADAYRTRSTISFPAIQGLFGNLAVTVDCEKCRNRLIRTQILRCIVLNPIHERCSLFSEADPEESVDGKGRVPYPRVTVIPVPSTTYKLGQACGRRGDNRSGGFEREKFQSQCRSLHLLSPSPLIGAGREPAVPELQSCLDELLGFHFRRRTKNAAIRPENEDL